MIVLGISALYHDSAAAIIKDGEIIAAVQEERFTRVKHDNRLPVNAIRFCLQSAHIEMYECDAVIYYDKPVLTLDRMIKNWKYLGEDAGWNIDKRLDDIINNRLVVDRQLRDEFGVLGINDELLTLEHHLSHAASAFYPSPFNEAAILTIDGVGEWATTTIGVGIESDIKIIEEIDYPHSLGLLYSAFTAFCGFKVNSGDYKFMGLAPYGDPIYYDIIKEKIIDIKEDGSYRLNLDYFDYYRGKYMTNNAFAELFGGPPRKAETRITRREMDIAASAQMVTEEVVAGLARHAIEITGKHNLVMAGGVALNCVANGKLLKEDWLDSIWIQPAAGDAGGALGCALYAYYKLNHSDRTIVAGRDSQKGSYLGNSYSDDEVANFVEKHGYVAHKFDDKKDLYKDIAGRIASQNVIGWFQGRMEYGPRSLGNRSILADPRSEKMQSILNLKIKYRESFRPFAPAVLKEKVSEYFEMDCESPYMLLVANVKKERCLDFDKEAFLKNYEDDMLPVVNAKRSDIPAVTHIDYSARIQTVDKETNLDFYKLLEAFEEQTGCGVLINTSFNVRGEPIVCSLEDAYTCFMRTEMDVLVLGNMVLLKEEQPEWSETKDWRNEYELD